MNSTKLLWELLLGAFFVNFLLKRKGSVVSDQEGRMRLIPRVHCLSLSRSQDQFPNRFREHSWCGCPTCLTWPDLGKTAFPYSPRCQAFRGAEAWCFMQKTKVGFSLRNSSIVIGKTSSVHKSDAPRATYVLGLK